MCGIIGVIGERNVTPILLEGLKRLEYRGYDSAGVAVNHKGGTFSRRAEGKLINLEKKLKENPLVGFAGIGHTRWATHGAPTEANAHPHASARVTVVHNGIIENHQALRRQLTERGALFRSDTDTEVIPHLIEQELAQGKEPEAAIRAAILQLEGTFALGILIKGGTDALFAVRRGSPLILGVGDGENFIASDATPLVPYTRNMIYLEDNDFAILTRSAIRLTDLAGNGVRRDVKQSQVNADLSDKGHYRHFMQKEIFEQPQVLGDTLKALVSPAYQTVELMDLIRTIDVAQITALNIVACGTSWHAGLIGRYWVEQLAGIPVSVDIASEYRYREPPSVPGTVTVVISQSGETADTLAALRFAKSQGQKVIAIVNVPESTISRESDAVIYTQAGPEIGVASTKAFTTQLLVLAVLAICLGRQRNHISASEERNYVGQLLQVPALMAQVLLLDQEIFAIARKLMHARGFLFLGRGTCFPIALEGALKLKEISYIHAEGYAAGEMKHGPIALIDEDLPVVVVAPRDLLFEKVLSNLEEARARGGRLVVLTTVNPSTDAGCQADDLISIVECGDFIAPILYVAPLQLLAYHIAVLKGTDVDQPRNLAKSVTVE